MVFDMDMAIDTSGSPYLTWLRPYPRGTLGGGRSTAGMANRLDPLRPPTHTLVGSGIAQAHAAVSFSDHRPSEGDQFGLPLPGGQLAMWRGARR